MKGTMLSNNTKASFAALLGVLAAMIAVGLLTGSTAAILGILVVALAVGGYLAALLSEDFARARNRRI
jgi:hypothetical protein